MFNKKQVSDVKEKLNELNAPLTASSGVTLETARPAIVPARPAPVFNGIISRLVELRKRRTELDREIANLEFERSRFEADPSLEDTMVHLAPVLEALKAAGIAKEA